MQVHQQQMQQQQQPPDHTQSLNLDTATQIQQADALRKEMYRHQLNNPQIFQAGTQRQQFALQAQAQRQYLQQQQQQQHQPHYFGLGGGQVQNMQSPLDSASGNAIGSSTQAQGSAIGRTGLPGNSLQNGRSVQNIKTLGSKYAQNQIQPMQGSRATGGHAQQTQIQQAQAHALANGENPQDALLRELFPGWFP